MLWGCISWYIPIEMAYDERMAVHCLKSGFVGLYIPCDLKILLGPRDVPQALPWGNLLDLGKSLSRRGCTTQYIPLLGNVRIQYIPRYPTKYEF